MLKLNAYKQDIISNNKLYGLLGRIVFFSRNWVLFWLCKIILFMGNLNTCFLVGDKTLVNNKEILLQPLFIVWNLEFRNFENSIFKSVENTVLESFEWEWSGVSG